MGMASGSRGRLAYNRSVAMRSAMWEWYMTWLCSSCSMSSGSISSLQNKVTGAASVSCRQTVAGAAACSQWAVSHGT